MSKEKETGKEEGKKSASWRGITFHIRDCFLPTLFLQCLGAAITLVIPLIVRYITSTVVEKPLEQATGEIIR